MPGAQTIAPAILTKADTFIYAYVIGLLALFLRAQGADLIKDKDVDPIFLNQFQEHFGCVFNVKRIADFYMGADEAKDYGLIDEVIRRSQVVRAPDSDDA